MHERYVDRSCIENRYAVPDLRPRAVPLRRLPRPIRLASEWRTAFPCMGGSNAAHALKSGTPSGGCRPSRRPGAAVRHAVRGLPSVTPSGGCRPSRGRGLPPSPAPGCPPGPDRVGCRPQSLTKRAPPQSTCVGPRIVGPPPCNRRMSTPRSPLPFVDVFTSADLPGAGVSAGALQGWRARHEVVELSPGVFIAADADRLEQRRIVFASRAIALGRQPVTLAGAALLHGLPVPVPASATWSRVDRHRRIPADQLVQSGGLLVPSLAWTAVHIARGRSLPDALIPLDAALRGGTDHGALSNVLASLGRGAGSAGLARAIACADAGAESPLESVSRGVIHVAGLPRPVLQQEFATAHGPYRVDFWWSQQGVIGEADGRVKYTDEDVLWREKRRRDALEELGLRVVRWSWTDVTTHRDDWVRHLRALLMGSGDRVNQRVLPRR